MPNKSSPHGGTIREGWIVSERTLRTQDLLRAFAEELERVKPFGEYMLRMEAIGHADVLERLDYNEQDLIAANECLNDVCDSLQTVAEREGLIFGVSSGDGACFGYWQADDYE